MPVSTDVQVRLVKAGNVFGVNLPEEVQDLSLVSVVPKHGNILAI
jgi:hypothetical protein